MLDGGVEAVAWRGGAPRGEGGRGALTWGGRRALLRREGGQGATAGKEVRLEVRGDGPARARAGGGVGRTHARRRS